MKNVIVIGVGKGLGKYLIKNLSDFDQKISVSRSEQTDIQSSLHLKTDVYNLSNSIDCLNKESISLVVYIPSEWWESWDVKLDEFEKFISTGPKGLLSCTETLINKNLLTKDALIVSIGSTASEEAMSVRNNSAHPIYSIAKITQKALVSQLARANKNLRFSTITLGSIGTDETGVGYKNIQKTIEYLFSLSPWVWYSEIELSAKSDIK